MEPIIRFEFNALDLMSHYRPRWEHPNKQTIFNQVLSKGAPFSGQIVYAQWPESALPSRVIEPSALQVCDDYFTYNVHAPTAVEWHMNFADSELFCAYESQLFAQDEMQVAEHPVLGALRDKLYACDHRPQTVSRNTRPTPVTVNGVQRHCSIDTAPTAKYPEGLYGSAFAEASSKEVIAATHLLALPSVSNILAISAPECGEGAYSEEEIDYILKTAYSGFSAAKQVSAWLQPSADKTVIHTGFWGCGAFGGNRTLMAILQVFAADLAGVELVFHAGDKRLVSTVEKAYQEYRKIVASYTMVDKVLDELFQRGYLWGVSDGN